jgi:hypothetical protein
MFATAIIVLAIAAEQPAPAPAVTAPPSTLRLPAPAPAGLGDLPPELKAQIEGIKVEFDGNAATGLGDLPPEIRAQIERIKAEFDSKAAAGASACESGQGAASTGSITTSVYDESGVATTTRIDTRDGKPWLTVEKPGAVIFSGPVSTPEEKAAIPPAVLQLLGDDFRVDGKHGDGSTRLELTTGQAVTGPATTRQ